MPVTVSRRTLLAGAAGLAGLGLAGLSAFDDVDLVRATLRRLVGDFRMAAADLDAFTRDFRAANPSLDGLKADLLRAGELVGIASVARVSGPAVVTGRIEKFERELLTAFVMSTTYLHVADPATETVEYLGALNACTNPFATFEPDETPGRASG